MQGPTSGLTITTAVPTYGGRLVAPALSLSTSLSSTLASSTLASPTLAGTPVTPCAATPCTLSSPSPRDPLVHLPALPHELLLIILSHLDDESLYALTRTCRSLHYLTVPYLLNKYDVQDPQRGWVVLFHYPAQIIPIIRSALFLHSPSPAPSTILSPTSPTSFPPSSPTHPHSPTQTPGPEPTSASIFSSVMFSPDSCPWFWDGGYRDGKGGISQIHVHFVGGNGCFRRFYHDSRALGRLMQNNGHGYPPTMPVDAKHEVDRPDRNSQATGAAYADNGQAGGVGIKLLKLHLSNLDSWISELRYRVMCSVEDEDDGVVLQEGNAHTATQYELAQESANDPQAHARSHGIIDINLNNVETATTGNGSAYQTDIGSEDRSDNGTETEADTDTSTQPHGHGHGRLSCEGCGSTLKFQDEHPSSLVGHSAHKYRKASKYRYPKDISRRSNKEIDIIQWREAVIGLLEIAIRKGCQELEVSSGQSLMSVYRLNGNKIGLKEMESLDVVEPCIRLDDGDEYNNTALPDVSGTTQAPLQQNGDIGELVSLEKPFALHKRLGSKVAGILRYIRRRPQENQDIHLIDTLLTTRFSIFPSGFKYNPNLPPTTASAPNKHSSNLRSVCFQSTFILHRPFQSWTLSILNSSPHLTKLSVENIELASEQWREVLRQLTLPAIENLCITQTDKFESMWEKVGRGGLAYSDDDEDDLGVLNDVDSGEGRGKKAAVGMMLEDLHEFLKRHETKIGKLKIIGNFQSWNHQTGEVEVEIDSGTATPAVESDDVSNQNTGDPQGQPRSLYIGLRSFDQDLFKDLEMCKLREIWAYPSLIGALIAPGPEKLRELKRITIVSGDHVGRTGYLYPDENGLLNVAAQVDGDEAGAAGEDEAERERELTRSDYRWFEMALKDVARFTSGVGVGAEVSDTKHGQEEEVSSPLASPRSATTRTSWKRSLSENTPGGGSESRGRVARRLNARLTTSECRDVVPSVRRRKFTLQLQCLSRNGLVPFLLSQSQASRHPPRNIGSSSSSSTESLGPHAETRPPTSIIPSLHNITELQIGTRWCWDFDEKVTEVLPQFLREFPDLESISVCDQTEEVRERLFGEEYWRSVGRELGFGGGDDTSPAPAPPRGDDADDVNNASRRQVKLKKARFNSMCLCVWNFELGKWTK